MFYLNPIERKVGPRDVVFTLTLGTPTLCGTN